MIGLLNAISWIFSLLITAFGVYIWYTGSLFGGISMLISAGIVMPLLRSKFGKLLGIKVKAFHRILAVIVIMLFGVFSWVGDIDKAENLEKLRIAENAGFGSIEMYNKALSLGASNAKEYHDKLNLIKESAKKIKAEAEQTRADKEQERLRVDAEKAVACKKDLQCWAVNNYIEGTKKCIVAVEKSNQFDFRWIENEAETKFPYFGWANDEETKIIYAGDSIKFQNGFGAWQIMRYECTYNPETKENYDFSIRPGRI